MRPIDADALKEKIEQSDGDGTIAKYCKRVLAECLDNDAPTIEAIPVEWLRNEAKLLIESEDGFDKYIGETLKAAAKYWNLKNEGTIGKWQKGQEAHGA